MTTFRQKRLREVLDVFGLLPKPEFVHLAVLPEYEEDG